MNVYPKSENIKTDFQKATDDIMLSKYTPAGVVVNDAMEIVHFSGNTANYLQQSPEKSSHNLLTMAKEGFPFELRNILLKAKQDQAPVIKENIPIQVNGVLQNITIETLLLPDTIEPHYLVLFHDNNPSGNKQAGNRKKTAGKIKKDERDERIVQLEKELAQSREDMHSITEEQKAVNKELMVVNLEMTGLNGLLTAAKDYAEAIIANIHEPLLVLDKNLCIKTANNSFYKTFHVTEKETEAVLIYDLEDKQWDIPELRTLLENILPEKSRVNDFEVRHIFSNIGERVMMLNAREVINKNSSEKLILLSIEDITERTKAQEVLNKSGEHFRHLVKELPAAIYSCDANGFITFYNNAAEKLWGQKPEIGKERWSGAMKLQRSDGSPIAKDNCPMATSIKEGISIVGEEIIIERPDGSRSVVLTNPQPEFGLSGEISGAINILFDITEEITARKRIEESETQFRLMAELMPQKVWTSDPEGNKNYFNQTLLDYAGMSFEELKGEGWEKVIHPDDWEKNKKQWLECLRTGKDYESENRLLRKDGNYLWHLTRAVALKDENGKIKMWVGSKTEIQEQREQKEELEKSVAKRTQELYNANKELRQKHHELFIVKEKLLTDYSRSLIEASLDPLVTISADGKITDVNEASIKITGMEREKLIGTNFSNYFTEPEKALKGYQQAFEKGFVADYPLTIKNLNGEVKDVLYNASVYKNEKGEVLGVFAAARDVTEQNRVSAELTEAIVFAELATEIAEIAKQKAEQSTHIAEEAVKAKQQFLSNMSHEIRTPMNAIIGFTKVLLKTGLTDKQKEYLSAIKISGDALIVLINDILDLAKVDAGKMTFEQIPFKLGISISAMLHLFEPKIQEKNIKLVKEYDNNIPEVVVGDPVRLHQVILNLVSNAVKFTNEGEITVSIRLVEDDQEKVTVEFSVADTGIGIAKDKIGKIFENFQQASSGTSRLYGGTGLGLAIVKQLLEPQGGVISVKSKINEGSVFSFRLSFLKTNETVESETEILKSGHENGMIKVLVVEDIALNQLLMKTLLDDFGFEMDIAGNGIIAIEKLKRNSYDIVLMDLQMPEMNGFEATAYIRDILKLQIPIIALTADVTTADLAKCKAVGMNDYIAKPVDEKLLYNKILSFAKKTAIKITDDDTGNTNNNTDGLKKYVNLDYLNSRTKSKPALMMEMIAAYLEQTLPLVSAMKQSWMDKDLKTLYSAVHKMIPSFSIMGISKDFENMAKEIQEFAGGHRADDGIEEMVLQLENACNMACRELEKEFIRIKNINS